MLRSIGLLVLAIRAYQVESLSVSGNSVGPLGSTITLYCTPGPLDRNVNWLTPDGKVHNNPTPRQTFGIQITSLEERHLGEYTCRSNRNSIMATIYVKLPEGDQGAISTTKRPIVSAEVRTTKLPENIVSAEVRTTKLQEGDKTKEGDQGAIRTTKSVSAEVRTTKLPENIVSADVLTTKLQEGVEDKTKVTTKTYIIYPGNGSKSQHVSSVLIGSVAHMKVFLACLNSMLD